MAGDESAHAPRVACDAMCGGLARWLRVLGVDSSYTPGIDDGDLVAHALAEHRIVLSSDGKLFERRVFATGALRGVRLPVGLKLLDQVRFVVRELQIQPEFPRCTLCNGELDAIGREEVADVVPARSLIWTTEFYRCRACRHVFWEGTHWRRIQAVRDRIAGGGRSLTSEAASSDNSL
ncbi:MAG TPA: Mut7-C RNAse domain-containing protein [Phycisphaerae bacterium]|nr:Mut7-C RNAse domain-containing protein [Phycisphaerae bacterium]HQL53939.1 Mut7-C RNAse domain-containing protein [Phycisphaerae bacterium]